MMKNYGECSLCNWVGTVEYHHIIPKRLKIKTNKKPKILWVDKHIDVFRDSRIEDIVIFVCSNCHKKLHPENVYHIEV